MYRFNQTLSTCLIALAGTIASTQAWAQETAAATQTQATATCCCPTEAAKTAEKSQCTNPAFAQDREAILAMAGEYKVNFQFRETVAAQAGYELKKPYNATATELVRVVEDTGTLIRLQHILVVQRGDAEPIVVKHWRQDWAYEKPFVMGYKGGETWERQEIAKDQVAGSWAQSVYQTDDSPRYESSGHWVHEAGQSYWESAATWRPLPRREYTKRQDYQVLVAKNRHTITPNGWVHEQDNRKVVLNDEGTPEAVIAHEIGVNSYLKTEDEKDLAALAYANLYWDQTQDFWQDVRQVWDETLNSEQASIRVRKQVKSDILINIIGDWAEDVLASGEYDQSQIKPELSKRIAMHTRSRG